MRYCECLPPVVEEDGRCLRCRLPYDAEYARERIWRDHFHPYRKEKVRYEQGTFEDSKKVLDTA